MPQNWWEAAPLAPTQDPNFTGFIPGTPKAPDALELERMELQRRADARAAQDQQFQVAKFNAEQAKDAPVDPALSSAIKGLGLDELRLSVQRARNNLKDGWATGVKGALGEIIPGSDRNNFQGNMDSIKGAAIMEKLAALKEASRTGASGMGALSEKEGERLASSIASLSDNMSQEELETSLQIIDRHALMLQAVADGKNPEDPAVASEYKIPPMPLIPGMAPPGGGTLRPGESIEFGAPPKPPGWRMTPEQEAQMGQFLASNRNLTGQQLQGALAAIAGGASIPDDEAEKIADYIRKGGDPAKIGISYERADALTPEQQAEVDKRVANTGQGGSAVAGLADSVSFGGIDEVGSGVDALAAALRGEGAFGELYDDKLKVNRGYQEALSERDPGTYLTGQLVGGVALPVGVGARGVRALAGVGAAQGAAYGFGSAEGNALDRLGGAATGGAIGGAVGAGLGAAAPYVGNALERVMRPRGRNPDLIRVLDDEGITPRGSLLEGGDSRAGALEAQPGSSPVIRRADAQTLQEVEGRVAQLSGGGEAYPETMVAGEAIQGAGARYIAQSGRMADRLYSRARGLAGDARIQPTNALQMVDDRIAALRENPETNGGEIAFFEGLRNDLAQDGGKSVDAARQLRRSIRGRINQDNLTATEAERYALQVMDALRTDARQSLPDGAARAFETGDRFYAERMAEIETLADRFTGSRTSPMSGEKAFAKFRSMATGRGGDGRRLAAVWRNLEPQEQQDMAATLVARLGRENDSPNSPFSAAQFISQVEKGLSPSARRTMFGPQGARSIDNLIEISRNVRQVQRRMNNSNTTRTSAGDIAKAVLPSVGGAGAIGFQTGSLVAGMLTGTVVLSGALAARGVRTLSARALMSPRLTRWLADAPSVQTAAQTRAYAERLGNIMAREPAIAAEIAPIHKMLTEGATSRAAASQPQGEGDE